MILPISSCEAERKLSEPLIIKFKKLINHTEERLKYISIVSIENDNTTFDVRGIIKDYTAEEIHFFLKALLRWIRQLTYEHVILKK
jgi:hypothetical protein